MSNYMTPVPSNFKDPSEGLRRSFNDAGALFMDIFNRREEATRKAEEAARYEREFGLRQAADARAQQEFDLKMGEANRAKEQRDLLNTHGSRIAMTAKEGLLAPGTESFETLVGRQGKGLTPTLFHEAAEAIGREDKTFKADYDKWRNLKAGEEFDANKAADLRDRVLNFRLPTGSASIRDELLHPYKNQIVSKEDIKDNTLKRLLDAGLDFDVAFKQAATITDSISAPTQEELTARGRLAHDTAVNQKELKDKAWQQSLDNQFKIAQELVKLEKGTSGSGTGSSSGSKGNTEGSLTYWSNTIPKVVNEGSFSWMNTPNDQEISLTAARTEEELVSTYGFSRNIARGIVSGAVASSTNPGSMGVSFSNDSFNKAIDKAKKEIQAGNKLDAPSQAENLLLQMRKSMAQRAEQEGDVLSKLPSIQTADELKRESIVSKNSELIKRLQNYRPANTPTTPRTVLNTNNVNVPQTTNKEVLSSLSPEEKEAAEQRVKDANTQLKALTEAFSSGKSLMNPKQYEEMKNSLEAVILSEGVVPPRPDYIVNRPFSPNPSADTSRKPSSRGQRGGSTSNQAKENPTEGVLNTASDFLNTLGKNQTDLYNNIYGLSTRLGKWLMEKGASIPAPSMPYRQGLGEPLGGPMSSNPNGLYRSDALRSRERLLDMYNSSPAINLLNNHSDNMVGILTNPANNPLAGLSQLQDARNDIAKQRLEQFVSPEFTPYTPQEVPTEITEPVTKIVNDKLVNFIQGDIPVPKRYTAGVVWDSKLNRYVPKYVENTTPPTVPEAIRSRWLDFIRPSNGE